MESTQPPIACPRLDLVLLGPEVVELVLAGEAAAASRLLGGVSLPAGHLAAAAEQRHLSRRLAQMRDDTAVAAWLVRLMVRRDSGEGIGLCGFHGAPEAGMAELGYRVFAPHRGHGYGREAAAGLMAWGGARGVVRFRASVAPDNRFSLAIVRGLGFLQVGEQWDDEDGLELVFERPADPAAAPEPGRTGSGG